MDLGNRRGCAVPLGFVPNCFLRLSLYVRTVTTIHTMLQRVVIILSKSSYTIYQIRKNKLLSESTVQKLREGKPISWENIETLCKLLNCQPNDIIEYIPD